MYASQKRKVKKSRSPLMNSTSKLLTTDEEKADVLNNILPQVSLASFLPISLKWMDHKAGTGGAKSLLL